MSLFERIAGLFREPDSGPSVETGPTADSGPTVDSGPSDDDRPENGEFDDGAPDDSAAENDEPDHTSAVVAVCQRSPEGLRTYTLEVAASDAEIVEVAPGLLSAHFEVVEGGVGASSVRARAVDFRGEARHVEAETLVGVRFAEPVPLADVTLRVLSAEDHAGETVPAERFRLAAVE